MVADTSQDRIFNVMDAIIEGRHNLAIGGVQNLIANGESIEGIFALLTRQVRILIVVGHMLSRGASRSRDWSTSAHKHALAVRQNMQASIANRIGTLEDDASAHVGRGRRSENRACRSSAGS